MGHDPEMARQFLVGERLFQDQLALAVVQFQRHFFGRSNPLPHLGLFQPGFTRVQQSVQILDAGCDGFTLHK